MSPRPPAGRDQLPGWLVVLTETLLGLVTLAVVFGFGRVFSGGEFGASLVIVTVYSHVGVAALRRRGVGVSLSMLISGIGFVLLSTWLFFGHTTTAFLPTARTWTAMTASLSSALELFQEVNAPAPTETGFLVASAAAVFVSAFLADWAAFRLWSGFEALVPALTLFIFCSLLGSEQLREVSTMLFAVAAASFFATHRTTRRGLTARWVTPSEDGLWSLVRAGLVLSVAAVVVGGLLIGPRLPGAQAGAIVSWRDEGDGPGDRFTVSPLVEINTRLVDQRDVELFTVRATEGAYWRLTALETFDGNAWRSKSRFTEAGENLAAAPETANGHDVTQEYSIEALGGLWLPAAMTPEQLRGNIAARYHDESSTLIVDSNVDNSDGFEYTIRSAVPSFTAEELRGADTSIPPEIAERYLGLPDGFSQTATDEANRLTRDAATAYDKLRTLQDWFRSDQFTYNLDVGPGHGDEAIENFLASREGYCEQFAGTFAAMARTLGIPSRVAVGFTQGTQDSPDSSLFRVSGKHAHAWPEVWLGEYGWVPFEPTKSRGAPNSAAWTGTEFAQAGESDGTTETNELAPTTTFTVDTAESADRATTTTAVATAESTDGGEVTTSPPGQPWWLVALVVSLILTLAVLVAGFVWVVTLRLLAKRNRLDTTLAGQSTRGSPRRSSQPPDDRVRLAWSEALDELEFIGVRPSASETHTEFAAREAADLSSSSVEFMDLARSTDLATFAPDYVDGAIAEGAEASAVSVMQEVRERMTTGEKLRSSVDPRPVWRSIRRG